MNYIALIQRFWRLHEEEHFSGNQTQLYFFLLEEFNQRGVGSKWPESIRLSDGALSAQVGQAPNTMMKRRKELEERGLIEWKTMGKGSRLGAEYRLKMASTSSKTSATTSANFDEVKQQPLQQPLQQPHQKPLQQPHQNLQTSYNNSNTKQQTTKLQTPNPNETGAGEGENDSDFPQKKTGENDPPPTPSQPAGRVINRDPFLFKSESEKTNVPFSQWYRAYDKDVNEDYCRQLWLELSDDQRQRAMEHTPPYVKSTPYKAKRLHPANYLVNKGFNDEIIDRHATEPSTPTAGTEQASVFTGKQYTRQSFKKTTG